MTNLTKFFITATLILSMQNAHILTQQPKANIIYANFSSITTEIEKLIFTLSPQKHAQIEHEGLLEETEAMHTQFLSIVAKAKEFILTESILDLETITKNIINVFNSNNELVFNLETLAKDLKDLKKYNRLNETHSNAILNLFATIQEILQISFFFHQEDEFLLILLSLLNHEINEAIFEAQGPDVDENTTNELLNDAKAILITLNAYGTAASLPQHKN